MNRRTSTFDSFKFGYGFHLGGVITNNNTEKIIGMKGESTSVNLTVNQVIPREGPKVDAYIFGADFGGEVYLEQPYIVPALNSFLYLKMVSNCLFNHIAKSVFSQNDTVRRPCSHPLFDMEGYSRYSSVPFLISGDAHTLHLPCRCVARLHAWDSIGELEAFNRIAGEGLWCNLDFRI